jgi:hypothetical protein
MIQAQQKRVSLIERLLVASTPEARSEIIKQDAAILDAEFFAIFGRLMESSISSGQQQTIQQMDAIQKQLLTETEFGRKAASQQNEVQEAIKTLKAVGKNLDREKLLELIIEAPNEDRVNALVSMTRPGLDYTFFQSLSERIEKKTGDERKKLETLREKLLDLTRKLDQRAEEEYKQASALLETLLNAPDIQKATAEHLPEIGDVFVQVLNQALQDANRKNDSGRMPKLQQVVAVLQQASAPPPELALLEEFLDAPDEAALNKLIEQHAEELTPEFTSIVASVMARNDEQAGDKPSTEEEGQVIAKMETIYKAILKFSMQKNLK